MFTRKKTAGQTVGNPNSESLDYTKAFGGGDGDYPKDTRLAKAYEVALDIRKFEIDLYWKRSNSFWLLVGGIAAALGFLLSGKADDAVSGMMTHRGKEVVCCCLSLAGATISYAWSLVNKGSKFWQRNWEYQVDFLEQAVLGPLYKTVFSDTKSRTMYSVSDINVWISRYLCLIFSASTIAFVIGEDGKKLLFDALLVNLSPSQSSFYLKMAVVVVNLFLVGLVRFRVRTKRGTDGEDDFDAKAAASVRAITVTELHGTPYAKANWESGAKYASVGKSQKA